MHYTYLLKLSNNNYYTGSTNNLKERIKEHSHGKCYTTKKFFPIKLVWYSGFKTKKLATNFEKYLKSSSGKAFRNKHFI